MSGARRIPTAAAAALLLAALPAAAAEQVFRVARVIDGEVA
jgi:hypothetical protein